MKIDGQGYSLFDQQGILPEKKTGSQESVANTALSADTINIAYKNDGAGTTDMINFEEAKNILQYVTDLSKHSDDVIQAHSPISSERAMQLLSMDA